MAVVGEAHIIVRALTSNVENDIKRGFKGLDGVAAKTGKSMGNALTRGLTAGASRNNVFGRLADELQALYPEAQRTAKVFTSLMRTGYTVQGAMGALAGTLGTVVGGIGALAGAAGGAAVSVISLGSALASAMVGAKIAGLALGGVWAAAQSLATGGGGGGGGNGAAEQAARIDDALKNLARTIEDNQNKIVTANNRIRAAQLNLNEALKAGREEIQQLGFDAEEAALSEQRAAIELERAREALARTQDLPPNSRARREAELAYQEAELNYRKAKDTASDTAAEQDRLAKQGVEGTQTVKDARQQLAEAEADLAQTVVQAAREQADAEKALADAYNNVAAGAGGALSAFDKLTASQKVFAEYLANVVIPKINILKEAVASQFLPALQTQMDRILNTGFFDRLVVGFAAIGAAAGLAVKNFTDALVNQTNADLFFKFLQDTADLLPRFGTIFGNVWGIVLRLIDASSGMTRNFVSFLESKTGALVNWLDAKKASGELDIFFANVERSMGKVGSIFGNVFNGLGDIIMANIGPGSGGDMLLSWLDKVSEGFANANPTYLNNYFKGAASNFISLADAFSVLINSIVRAGADPAVGEFWRVLASGATAFDTIVREAVRVGPSLARLVQQVTEIIAILADSGQAMAFFDTLSFIAGAVKSVLGAMKPLLDAIGPAIGIVSALGFMFTMLGNGLLVMNGLLQGALRGFSLLIPTMGAAGEAGIAAGAGMTAALGPVGIAIAVVAAAAVGLGILFGIAAQNSEKASNEITKGFEKNASSAEIFNSALLAIGDGPGKESLVKIGSTIGGLSDALESSRAKMDSYTQSSGGFARANYMASESNRNLNDAMNAIGKSLGDLAVKELPDAQAQFKRFTDEQNLSKVAQEEALRLMPEYSKQLEEQAKLYGIDLYNAQTGAIDQEKMLAFARGEGEIATIRETAALKEQAAAATESIRAAVDSMEFQSGKLEESKVNYSDYLAEVQAKTVYTAKEIAAQNELIAAGVSATAIQEAADAGVSIQQMRDDILVNGVKTIEEANRATQTQTQIFEDAVNQMSKNGLSELEKAAQQAYLNNEISLDEFISLTGTKLDNFNPSVDVLNDITSWNNLPQTLRDIVPQSITTKIAFKASGFEGNVSGYIKWLERKDGGYIPKFASGGLFPGGGPVSGPGGPRDDRVPAMLSAGEYVINAMATKRYKPLLQAINNGSPISTNVPSGSNQPNINITVNPSPGMDERELASAISREISFQMRKGAVA